MADWAFDKALAKLVVAEVAALPRAAVCLATMAAADDATDDISVMRSSRLAKPSVHHG
jgi:hypothetical protein